MSSQASSSTMEETAVLNETGAGEIKEIKNMDDFLHLGRYSVYFLVIIEVMTMTSLMCMVSMVYAGAAPTVIGCGDIMFNSTVDGCEVLAELRNRTGCKPKLDYQFYSVNIEFDYLCGDSKLVKNTISYQMIGVLVGSVLFGQVSDLFGRKLTILVSLAGLVVCSIANAYVPTFFYFTISRIVLGFFTGGLNTVQGVFMIENIPKNHRMWISTIITWSPNFIIFPFIAKYCAGWRALLIAQAITSGLAFVGMCFCFESPRFLIQKGRIAEAREIFRRIRKINGDTCEVKSEEIEHMLKHEQNIVDNRVKKQSKCTYYHTFCTWKLLTWTTTFCCGIAVASLVNYSLMFNMEKLSGSIYLNNVFLGIIRWSMNISVGVSDYSFAWFGRKVVNMIAVSFNSICLGTVVYFYVSGTMSSGGLAVRVCTIGVTAMCSQIYLAKFIACNELYPTAIRNLAVSMMSMFSRLGTIVAPQLFYLTDIHPAAPYLVLCVLTVIDLVAFQVLIPETKGKSLENHLPPKEQRFFQKNKKEHRPLVTRETA